jgi:hypothetical protein
MFNYTYIDNSLTVHLTDAKPANHLNEKIKTQVDSIWKNEQIMRGKHLFNGKIFSIMQIEPNKLTGYFVEYKWFIAQQRAPELFDELQVRPLAVSGLLECENSLIFGLRASSMTQAANQWELVPSGGIDSSLLDPDHTIQYRIQILTELHEEVGIASSYVTDLTPYVIIEDLENHVVDIGIRIKTSLTFAQVKNAFDSLNNKEYQQILAIPKPELDMFIINHHVVEASKLLIAHNKIAIHAAPFA